MKRLTLSSILIFIVVLFFAFPSQAGKTKKIMQDGVLAHSGSSIYIIDTLKSPDYEMADIRSFQISGTTCRYIRPASGATVSILVTSMNELPTTLTGPASVDTLLNQINGAYNWKYVIKNMDILTGNTIDQYPFDVTAGRYIAVRIDNSGTTDITAQVFMGFHETAGWLPEITQSEVNEIDLEISGVTTGRGIEVAYSGVSWFTFNNQDTVLDVFEYKPNLCIWSLGLKPQSILALSNENNITYTGTNTSATSMTFVYTCSNFNDENSFVNSGITTIFVPTISGQSVCGQVFTPEFMRYYKIGFIPTGVSNFDSSKIDARLLLQ